MYGFGADGGDCGGFGFAELKAKACDAMPPKVVGLIIQSKP